MTAQAPLTPEAFAAAANVSRETLDRLKSYAALLAHWQRRINLVSDASLADLWRRHMLDSTQLLPLAPEGARAYLDLGSGAGFPGLVLALCAADRPGFAMHLVESDGRKCAFLNEAIRDTGAPALVHNGRAETLPAFKVDVITARALAPLPALLGYCHRFWGPDTVALLPRGRKLRDELQDISQIWSIIYDEHQSLTDSSGRILRIRSLAPCPTPSRPKAK